MASTDTNLMRALLQISLRQANVPVCNDDEVNYSHKQEILILARQIKCTLKII